MRRLRPSLLLALVAVLLAAALAVATLVRPDSGSGSQAVGPAAARSVPVSNSTLVCPDASAVGQDSSTDVTVVAAPSADGAVTGVGGSLATARRLTVDAPALVAVDARGLAATAAVRATDFGPVLVSTVGELAPGLSAGLLTTTAAGDVTGIAAAGCTEPATESWFLGVGTELGHRPRLDIANVEQTPAELDVVLYDATGPLDLGALRDLVIPAGGTVTYELETLAPDRAELAVAVRTTAGRMAASVRDSQVDGLASLGFDWVPAAAAPAERVIVPGVAGGGGARRLHLLAPGELDTRVQVRAFTRTGAIVPVGLEEVELTAGVVRTVDLAAVLESEVAAVELTADEPIAAAVRADTAGEDRRDMAFTAGALPLVEPAVVPGVRLGDGWTARVVLSADPAPAPADLATPIEPGPSDAAGPSDATTAEATPTDEASATATTPAGPTTQASPTDDVSGTPTPTGSPAPGDDEPASARVVVQLLDAATGDVVTTEEVEIAPGATLEVNLAGEPVEAGGEPGRYSVVVTPAAGAVYGTVQLARTGGADEGSTLRPLVSARLEVEVPVVRQDLSTGLQPGR